MMVMTNSNGFIKATSPGPRQSPLILEAPELTVEIEPARRHVFLEPLQARIEVPEPIAHAGQHVVRVGTNLFPNRVVDVRIGLARQHDPEDDIRSANEWEREHRSEYGQNARDPEIEREVVGHAGADAEDHPARFVAVEPMRAARLCIVLLIGVHRSAPTAAAIYGTTARSQLLFPVRDLGVEDRFERVQSALHRLTIFIQIL